VRLSLVPDDVRAIVRDEAMTRPESLRAGLHCAALVAAFAALSVVGVWAGSLWAWVPLWIAQGFLLHGAYSAMHDAAHGTLFSSRRANRVACFAWSVPLLLNPSLWRCWHLEHHRATRTADDPEPRGAIPNVAVYVVAFPVAGASMLLSFWVHSARALLGHPPSYAARPSARPAVRRDALWILALSAGLVTAGLLELHWLVVIWLAPWCVYWLVVSLVFGLAEHELTPTEGTQIDVTRSVTSNRVIQFVVWNSNFHAAHHLVPTVTYRHLPRLDAVLGDRVAHRARSYTRYHAAFVRGTFARPSSADARS
jgi:fatty acid desaturase